MKFIIYTLLFAFTFCYHTPAFAVVSNSNKLKGLTFEQQQQFSAFKEKVNKFFEKRKTKLKKRIDKMQAKIAKKRSAIEAPADTSGIKLGLIIVIIGVVIALLGFAGIADILVTIGLVVLVVGLLLWLLGYL